MPDEAVSAVVLRGRAVDVPMRDQTEQGIETIGIVFDANVLADLEERYSQTPITVQLEDDDGAWIRDDDGNVITVEHVGIQAWQDSMQRKPYHTLRETLAIALGVPPRDAGRRMIEEHLPDYFMAVGAAFAIANGVDPTDALAKAQEQMRELMSTLAEQNDSAGSDNAGSSSENENPSDTPGTTGSQPGPEQADPLTSSGG